MDLITLEHSRLTYWADFVLYGAVVVGLTAFLVAEAPRAEGVAASAWALAGVLTWTIVEYALHRFILHGLQPFRGWHEAHHQRPAALICAPTVFSGSLIVGLVFLPAWWLGGLWCACAITLGLLIGYFAYSLTHHAAHHWRADNDWLKRRKRCHALHHRAGERGHFGVTSSLWDRVFGSAGRRAR